jgi:osmotically-inducible protein OsmY
MKNKPVLFVASLILALGLGACDKPGPAEQAGKKMDEVATDTGNKIDQAADKIAEQGAKTAQIFNDAEITTKVKADILAEPGLKSLEISVDTINGIVTLTGLVDSTLTGDKVRNLAAAVNGVKEVNNQLVVTPAK